MRACRRRRCRRQQQPIASWKRKLSTLSVVGSEFHSRFGHLAALWAQTCYRADGCGQGCHRERPLSWPSPQPQPRVKPQPDWRANQPAPLMESYYIQPAARQLVAFRSTEA